MQRRAQTREHARGFETGGSVPQPAHEQRIGREIERKVPELSIAEIQERRGRQQRQPEVAHHVRRPPLDEANGERRDDEPGGGDPHQQVSASLGAVSPWPSTS